MSVKTVLLAGAAFAALAFSPRAHAQEELALVVRTWIQPDDPILVLQVEYRDGRKFCEMRLFDTKTGVLFKLERRGDFDTTSVTLNSITDMLINDHSDLAQTQVHYQIDDHSYDIRMIPHPRGYVRGLIGVVRAEFLHDLASSRSMAITAGAVSVMYSLRGMATALTLVDHCTKALHS